MNKLGSKVDVTWVEKKLMVLIVKLLYFVLMRGIYFHKNKNCKHST